MPDQGPSVRDRVQTAVLRLVIGGLVLGLAPLGRYRAYVWDAIDHTDWNRAVLVVVATTGVLGVVWALPGAVLPSLAAPLVAVTAGAAMWQIAGKTIGAWLAFTTLMAAWGVCKIRPAWFLRRPDGSAIPGLLLLAALAAKATENRYEPPRAAFFLTAMMVVPTALSLPYRPAEFVARQIKRVALGVGTAVSTVMLSLVAIAAIVAPWLAHRITRWNPVRAHSAGGWIDREPTAVQAPRMWFGDQRPSSMNVVRRLHGLSAAVVTIALLVPVALAGRMLWQSVEVGGLPFGGGGSDEPFEETGIVIRDRVRAEPWTPQLNDENQQSFSAAYFSQWVGTELGPVDGKYIDVVDGRRTTWQPPKPACGVPVDLWMFGGSTTFSVAARTDHTVPSELAKLADREGISLRVTNFGVPGDVAWQESRRLERAIENHMPLPDLVIFFDSFNDMSSVGVQSVGRGGLGDFVGPMDRLQMTALSKLGVEDGGKRYVLDVPTDPPAVRSAEDLAASSLRQYLAADDSSRRLLSSYGVPSVRFAQASLWSRDRRVPGEPSIDPLAHDMDTLFRKGLPDRIVDLGDMFHRSYGPVFSDDVHTDERGNRIVARELFRHLERRLRPISERGGTPCS